MFPYTFFLHSSHQLQKVLNYNFKFAAVEKWLNNGKSSLASKLITMLMRAKKKVLKLRNYAATENDDWSINKSDKLLNKLLVWKELGYRTISSPLSILRAKKNDEHNNKRREKTS